jgi:hypothetical protein
MGRFNWIWRAPCALSVLVFAWGAPAPAAAFSPTDNETYTRVIGTCNLTASLNAAAGAAYIYLANDPVTWLGYPEASYFSGFQKYENQGDFNETDIAECLGTNVENITTLIQNGADGTFEEDNYIGFKFSLGEAVGAFDAGVEYEYKIGTESLLSTGPSIEETQELVAGYMQNRASQTIAAQPDLIGFLSGASTGSFNADVTQSNGNFDFATSGDQPVWATLQGSWSEFGTAESSYFFGAVGAHTNLSPDALVGLMFQFDRLTQTDGATSVEGDGYLVGPYFVAKLPNQPLFIEGRLLTGQTDNEVSVGGAATETFDTQRTFASIKVAGQLHYGELVLTPSLTATHLRDEQDAFVNTQGNTVAAQGIEVNSVAAGLNFAQPVSLSNGELMLTGGISGIWSTSEGTEFASSAAPTTDGQRARITLGASHTLPNGVVLSAGTFYDGIGLNDYESYGLDLGIQMQF